MAPSLVLVTIYPPNLSNCTCRHNPLRFTLFEPEDLNALHVHRPPPKFSNLPHPHHPQPTSLSDFKTPGADLQGVYYLRNEADAAILVKAMESTKAAGGKVSAGREGEGVRRRG